MLGLRTVSILAVAGTLALPVEARAQEALPNLPPVPRLAPTPPPAVWVHLDASSSVEIQRDTPIGWSTVCAGTCDLLLPVDGSYRATGSTLFPSAPFTLRSPPGQSETLQVHGGSEPLFVLGMVGVIGGGLVASITWPVGAVFGLCLGFGVLSGGPPGGVQGCVPDGTQGLLTAFLVSGAVVLVSTVLVVSNAKTTVDHLFSSTPPPPSLELGWKPAPSWRERAADPQPPALAVPILQGRF